MRAIFPDEAENRLKEEFFGSSFKGFFVEVGANDPRRLSQTWHFEQSGWVGILIEPQPDLAERLRSERTARVYAVACSSPANSGKRMTLHMAGIYSSLNPDFFARDMRREGLSEVPIRTLDEILTEANAPAPLDFVSVDVEGHEIEVLSGLGIERWQPRLILIEDLVLDLRLHRYMQSRAYKWVRRTGLNSWYVPAAAPMLVDVLGHLQFFRKYYLGVPFRRLREAKRRIQSRFRR